MEWAKLPTSYPNDPAMMRAGEAAEVLWARAFAYSGEHETDGFVPAEVLARLTPARGKARAAALVREGLWEAVPGGWTFTGRALDLLAVSDQVTATREAGRLRQAAHRARQKETRNSVRNAVTNGEVTRTELEVEVDTAAAAARDAVTPPATAGLPAAVEILRAKLEAHKLNARWDRLTADQIADIERLINLHGDAPLVKSALAAYQPDSPPVFAKAWLGGWAALPAPGRPLQLVEQPRGICDIHTQELLADGTCRLCLIDRKVRQ